MPPIIVATIPGLSSSSVANSASLNTVNRIASQQFYRDIIPCAPALAASAHTTILTGTGPKNHGVLSDYFHTPHGVSRRDMDDDSVKTPLFSNDEGNQDPPHVAISFLSPRLLNTVDTGMVCSGRDYSTRPPQLYEVVRQRAGPFDHRHFWGPVAGLNGPKASQWIVNASKALFEYNSPELLFMRIPHLDYVCQRYGISSDITERELTFVDSLVADIANFAENKGAILVVLSEYAYEDVHTPVFINWELRRAGLTRVYEEDGKEYIDPSSEVVAVPEHQTVLIYTSQAQKAKEALQHVDGIEEVRMAPTVSEGPALIGFAKQGHWFCYHYWRDQQRAPPFAYDHRAIKCGHEPLELFAHPITGNIPLEPEKIKGSHGRAVGDAHTYGLIMSTSSRLDDIAPLEVDMTHVASLLNKIRH